MLLFIREITEFAKTWVVHHLLKCMDFMRMHTYTDTDVDENSWPTFRRITGRSSEKCLDANKHILLPLDNAETGISLLAWISHCLCYSLYTFFLKPFPDFLDWCLYSKHEGLWLTGSLIIVSRTRSGTFQKFHS